MCSTGFTSGYRYMEYLDRTMPGVIPDFYRLVVFPAEMESAQ